MTIPSTTPPLGLYEAVLKRVADARRRAARVQLTFLAAFSCVLTALSVTALQYALAEASTSGFASYVSLLFSDSALVLTSRDFLLSLVESLPSLAVILVAVLVGALVWSLYRAARTARSIFAYV